MSNLTIEFPSEGARAAAASAIKRQLQAGMRDGSLSSARRLNLVAALEAIDSSGSPRSQRLIREERVVTAD